MNLKVISLIVIGIIQFCERLRVAATMHAVFGASFTLALALQEQ